MGRALMAFLILDTDPDSLNYVQTTQLEGVEYVMHFYWSTREDCWYLDITDQEANELAMGVRLVVNWPVLRRFVDPRLPLGILTAIDMSGAGLDIEASTDLGSRVILFYITSDDEALSDGE